MSHNKINVKYVPRNLSKEDEKKTLAELRKSKEKYKKGEYYERKKVKSFKSKPSPHVKKAMNMYNVKSLKPTRELAKKTGCTIKAMNQILDKGRGAYYSSGSRPNQTAHSWAYARLASSLTGGKAASVDYHILEKGCKKDSKVLKLAAKATDGRKKAPKRKVGGISIMDFIINH